MQALWKHLAKLFVLSLALFSLSFSCSPEDVVKKVVENSIKSIGDTENASQTPPNTTGASPATGTPNASQTPPNTTGASPATGTPNASQTPPNTSGPTCDLNNVTDECYDLLAGWYEGFGSFIYFSGKDTKTVAMDPLCNKKVSDYTDIYTIRPKGEIAWKFQGINGSSTVKAEWDGADTFIFTMTDSTGTYKPETHTRRPDLANEVSPPSWAGTDCAH